MALTSKKWRKYSIYAIISLLFILWLIGVPIVYMWILIKLGHALNLSAEIVHGIFMFTLPTVWGLVSAAGFKTYEWLKDKYKAIELEIWFLKRRYERRFKNSK